MAVFLLSVLMLMRATMASGLDMAYHLSYDLFVCGLSSDRYGKVVGSDRYGNELSKIMCC